MTIAEMLQAKMNSNPAQGQNFNPAMLEDMQRTIANNKAMEMDPYNPLNAVLGAMLTSPRPAYDGRPAESSGDHLERMLLDPNVDDSGRGDLLPIVKTRQGHKQFGLPSALVDFLKFGNTYMNPGSASTEDVANASLSMPLGSLVAQKLVPNSVPEGDVLGMFADSSPDNFLASLLKNESPLVEKKTVADYQKVIDEGGKVRLHDSGNAGYALTKDGELGSVFSNDPGKGYGNEIMDDAVSFGAKSLDAFGLAESLGSDLPKFYGKHGFNETGRMPYDPVHGPDNMPAGETPDVVFMKRQPTFENSPEVDIEGVKIPGGLEGKFTLSDLAKMKANPMHTGSLSPETVDALYKKHMRTMQPNLNDPLEVFNRLMFGQLSANTDLESSEMMLARLRARNFDDVKKLAEYLPEGKSWREMTRPATYKVDKKGKTLFEKDKKGRLKRTKAGKKIPVVDVPSERKEVSDAIKFGKSMQARKDGGMGLASTNDFSAVAELARQFVKHPEFFAKKTTEDDLQYVERLGSVVPSIGPKTGSLARLVMDPMNSGLGAIDRHMIEILGLDPTKIGANKSKIIAGKANKSLGVKKGDYMPGNEHFKDVNFPEFTPTHAEKASPEYLRGLGLLEERAKKSGLSIGGQQWRDWDQRRGYFAPHMQLMPGMHNLPPMGNQEKSMRRVRDLMSKSGHWSGGVGDESHQFKPKQLDNYKDLIYWNNPAESAMPSILAEMLKEEQHGMLADQSALNRDAVLAEQGGGSYWRDREGEERAMQEMQNEMLSFLPIGGGLRKVMVRTPWDSKILSGEKTMETATFGLPERFKNVPHVIQNEAREGLGRVTFGGGRKVNSAEEFDSLYNQHLVPRASRFHYTQPEGKMPRKYLWEVGDVKKYKTPKKLKPFKGQFRFQEE